MSSDEEGRIKQGTIAQFMRKRTQLVGFEFGYWKHQQYASEFLDNALDAIEEFQDSIGAEKLSDIDPCYVAWDTILQEARNEIDDIIDFDICNDIENGTEFYTAGYYCCTQWDYSEEAQEELIHAIANAGVDKLNELLEDELIVNWLKEVDISVDDIYDEFIYCVEDNYSEDIIKQARSNIHSKYKDTIDNSNTENIDKFIDLIIEKYKKEFIDELNC